MNVGTTSSGAAPSITSGSVTDRPLAAATIDAAGDHRIAMSAAVGALSASGPVRIDDVANVATSFPTFGATLENLGAPVRDAER